MTLDRGGGRPEFARAKKRLKNTNGVPIGVANDNPILNSRMYEVEYCDGYVAVMSANVIVENILAQIGQEGNRFVLIKSIIDTRTDRTQKLQQDALVITKSDTKRRKIQLKDGKSTYNGRMVVVHRKNLNISRLFI